MNGTISKWKTIAFGKNKKQAIDWEKIFAKHKYLPRIYNNAITEGEKQLKMGEIFE